jgi:proliferating cell nuclear antigen
VRDLSALGESVRIEVSKEGVRFASEGESANGSILLKKDGEISRVLTDKERKAAKARARGEEPEEDDEEENGDDEDKPKEKKIKKEKVKKEKDGDEDVEMDEEEKDEEEFKAESDEEEKSEGGSDDEEEGGKKRKKKVWFSFIPFVRILITTLGERFVQARQEGQNHPQWKGQG